MIALLKYNAGNTTSVANAIQRLGYKTIITDDEKQIKAADKVIFPGVGEASSAMRYLKSRNLDELLKSLQQPVLGICLGMQLMCDYSEENNTKAIGIFTNTVKKFPQGNIVPHTGWNNFTSINGALFNNIRLENDCYYVHGYYADVNQNTVAETHYIVPFSAALQKDNFYATQFHPEKSSKTGIQILENFLTL
jgi:glutamine amidotransferase